MKILFSFCPLPRRHLLPFLLGLAFALALLFPAGAAFCRPVTDMRGKVVDVPDEPRRIATIDDGFVEAVMTHLGVIDRVVAIGSWSMKRDYRYTFTSIGGEAWEHRGWNTMKFLHPWISDLPCVTSPQGYVVNFEILAQAAPDLVILRVGDCTVNNRTDGTAERVIAAIESMGLPLVVLYAPQGTNLSSMLEEMAVLGEIFGQRERAVALGERLAATEALVRERTANVREEDKPRLLYLGLNPAVREQGGAGTVHGVNTPESHIIEGIANARNAFRGQGSGVPVSAEHIYALDPDVILLPTANGYHPPRELCEAPYYAVLQELDAVREGRVYAMPWTPMNCARRVEYPLDLLIVAKAAYPERFSDISVYDFALEFYQSVYGVDKEIASGLRSTQLLDWMAGGGF